MDNTKKYDTRGCEDNRPTKEYTLVEMIKDLKAEDDIEEIVKERLLARAKLEYSIHSEYVNELKNQNRTLESMLHAYRGVLTDLVRHGFF